MAGDVKVKPIGDKELDDKSRGLASELKAMTHDDFIEYIAQTIVLIERLGAVTAKAVSELRGRI